MPASISNQALPPPVIQAMLKPEFYPHPAPAIELHQTHTSYVLLVGEFAYKVRKATRFAFIDCSTATRRLALCRREFELNRRLAPDVYLAVVAIGQSGGRFFLIQTTNSPTDAIEFAVKMHRLPEHRRLDFLIKSQAATADNIKQIADTVGNFHAVTPNTHSWDYGAAASIWRMTIGNLTEIEQLGPPVPLLVKIAQLESYSRRYIAAHWELFNDRARSGHVHEGHGDLRADAIYLTPGGIRIIDCLEFDERLRYVDLANEVAFLAMDVDRLGRPELSQELVAHFAHDQDLTVLMRFYQSYRATVRAKIELLRSRQSDCATDDQQSGLAAATQLLDLAINYSAGPKVLLIVCGASGTGKSTLAAMLGEHLDLAVFSSDLIRKRLMGIEQNTRATAPYNQGIYAPEVSIRVYDSLLSEARRTLNMGEGAILDATFSQRSQRQLITRSAQQAGVRPLFIECRASPTTVVQRLLRRQQDGQQISDANVATYLSQIKDFEPIDELPPACHQVVNTTDDMRAIVLQIERRIYSSQYSSAQDTEGKSRAPE